MLIVMFRIHTCLYSSTNNSTYISSNLKEGKRGKGIWIFFIFKISLPSFKKCPFPLWPFEHMKMKIDQCN